MERVPTNRWTSQARIWQAVRATPRRMSRPSSTCGWGPHRRDRGPQTRGSRPPRVSSKCPSAAFCSFASVSGTACPKTLTSGLLERVVETLTADGSSVVRRSWGRCGRRVRWSTRGQSSPPDRVEDRLAEIVVVIVQSEKGVAQSHRYAVDQACGDPSIRFSPLEQGGSPLASAVIAPGEPGQSMVATSVSLVMLMSQCTKRSPKSLRWSQAEWWMRSSVPASAV